MTFISVTRLRLRSPRYLPLFAWYTFHSSQQIRRAPGFITGAFIQEPKLSFWTVSAWSEQAAMRHYRNRDAHRRAMPKLLDWCDEASIAHWEQADATLPTANEALAQMVAQNHLSKVRNPSADHAAKRIVPAEPLRVVRQYEPAQQAATLTK